MTEEQIEHIKTLLAHEDSAFVQQGLTLLETAITSAEKLCAFFGIEDSNGFSPIAEQIGKWTFKYGCCMDRTVCRHTQHHIYQERSRHYRIRINRGWQLTYRMTELTRKGYDFWSQSDYDLDEYIKRFDNGTEDDFNVPTEANFCTKNNWEDGWETDWDHNPNLAYENLHIEINEHLKVKNCSVHLF